MTMDFSPDALKAHLADLNDRIDLAESELQPLRDELAQLVSGDTNLSVKKAAAREAKIRAEIRQRQNALYPLEMERAAVARALGGKTLGSA